MKSNHLLEFKFIFSDEGIENKHEYINSQISDGIKIISSIVKLVYSKAGEAAFSAYNA